jgi:hypothetical protein
MSSSTTLAALATAAVFGTIVTQQLNASGFDVAAVVSAPRFG